jgi:hypothetical protein
MKLKTDKHPEDEIFRVKTFINELQKVQDKYFQDLVSELHLTSEGEEFLFDYIFNETEDCDGFDGYINTLTDRYYNSFVEKKVSKNKIIPFNSKQNKSSKKKK